MKICFSIYRKKKNAGKAQLQQRKQKIWSDSDSERIQGEEARILIMCLAFPK